MEKTLKAIRHEFESANTGDWVGNVGIILIVASCLFAGVQAFNGNLPIQNQENATAPQSLTLGH